MIMLLGQVRSPPRRRVFEHPVGRADQVEWSRRLSRRRSTTTHKGGDCNERCYRATAIPITSTNKPAARERPSRRRRCQDLSLIRRPVSLGHEALASSAPWLNARLTPAKVTRPHSPPCRRQYHLIRSVSAILPPPLLSEPARHRQSRRLVVSSNCL